MVRVNSRRLVAVLALAVLSVAFVLGFAYHIHVNARASEPEDYISDYLMREYGVASFDELYSKLLSQYGYASYWTYVNYSGLGVPEAVPTPAFSVGNQYLATATPQPIVHYVPYAPATPVPTPAEPSTYLILVTGSSVAVTAVLMVGYRYGRKWFKHLLIASSLIAVFVLGFHLGTVTAQTVQVYITPQSFTEPYSYIVFKDADGLTKVKDGMTGQVVYASSDDASAIQYAVDNMQSGGKVLIRSGIYYIGKTINITRGGVYIEGECTGHSYTSNPTILQASGLTGAMFSFYTSGNYANFGGISNIQLDGNRQASVGIEVKAEQNDLVFENVFIYRFSTGIKIVPSWGFVHHVWIRGCWIELNNNVGIYVWPTQNAVVKGLYILYNRFNGGAEHIQINGSQGVVDWVTILGNHFDTPGARAILLQGVEGSINIIANMFCGGGNANYDDILMGNYGGKTVKNVNVVGNIFLLSNAPSQLRKYYINIGNSQIDYINIQGNIFKDISGLSGAPVYVASGANAHGIIKRNIGYVTENSGTAVIPAGQTRVTVNHGLASAPSKVLITPLGQPTGKIWVENITSTSFDIVTDTAPTSNLTVAWYAEV